MTKELKNLDCWKFGTTDSKLSIGNPIGEQRSAAGKCFGASSKRRMTRRWVFSSWFLHSMQFVL